MAKTSGRDGFRRAGMAHKSGIFNCGSCGKRTRATNETASTSLCPPCYEAAGIENAHSDGAHEGYPEPSCPACQEDAKTASATTVSKVEAGQKVAAIGGPGQSPTSGARIGTISKVEPTRWGAVATVEFEDGTTEGFSVGSFRDESEASTGGIGVYLVRS